MYILPTGALVLSYDTCTLSLLLVIKKKTTVDVKMAKSMHQTLFGERSALCASLFVSTKSIV